MLLELIFYLEGEFIRDSEHHGMNRRFVMCFPPPQAITNNLRQHEIIDTMTVWSAVANTPANLLFGIQVPLPGSDVDVVILFEQSACLPEALNQFVFSNAGLTLPVVW